MFFVCWSDQRDVHDFDSFVNIGKMFVITVIITMIISKNDSNTPPRNG